MNFVFLNATAFFRVTERKFDIMLMDPRGVLFPSPGVLYLPVLGRLVKSFGLRV
jgi:hypothetical protein